MVNERQTHRYRKKPVTVHAVRYRPGPGGNCVTVAAFLGDDLETTHVCDKDDPWVIETPEGNMEASPGDWIVRGIEGEFYPVKHGIFAATYEPVEN